MAREKAKMAKAERIMSLSLTDDEKQIIVDKAKAEGTSVSRLCAVITMRMVKPAMRDIVADYIRADAGHHSATIKTRESRVSVVVSMQEWSLIKDVARQANVAAHTWVRAVCVHGVFEAPPATARPASPLSGFEVDMIRLLSSTLAAFLNDPAKAPMLAGKLRQLGRVPADEPLTAAKVESAALQACEAVRAAPKQPTAAPQPAPPTNVVPIRPDVEMRPAVTPATPKQFTRFIDFVQDEFGNSARIETFGNFDACEAALLSCVACRDCIDCVACVACVECVKCAQIKNGTGLEGRVGG